MNPGSVPEAGAESRADEMIHMVIHDLRTPLTAVSGYLDLLLATEACAGHEDALTWLQDARRAARRMGQMLSSVLELRKLEAGESEPHTGPCDPARLVQDALSDMGSLLAGRELSLDLPPGLPAVPLDYGLMRQVVENLTANALKFTPEGGVVRVRLRVSESHLLLEIEDGGDPWPEETWTGVFDKSPAATPAGQRRSQGLSLSFCRAVVEAHRGSIAFRGLSERGNVFKVELPRGSAARST